jgi:hypothetical protein
MGFVLASIEVQGHRMTRPSIVVVRMLIVIFEIAGVDYSLSCPIGTV